MFDKNQLRQVPRAAGVIQPLEFYLGEQIKILDGLAELLAKERLALRDRQMQNLNDFAEQKSALMLKLQSNDQRLKMHPQMALLKTVHAARVQQIKLKLAECKRRNEINGKLIMLCLKSTRRVSALLMDSRDRYTRNMTYTAKGATTARGPARLNIVA